MKLSRQNPNKKKTTHSIESAFIFLKQNNYELNKDTLPIFITILKHHGNLEDINELAYNLADSEEIIYKYPNILKKIKEIFIVAKINNDFEIEDCCDFFAEEPFIDYYKFTGIDNYFKIKETFAKLIFSDK